jgi:hypothetical protein
MQQPTPGQDLPGWLRANPLLYPNGQILLAHITNAMSKFPRVMKASLDLKASASFSSTIYASILSLRSWYSSFFAWRTGRHRRFG